MVVFLELDGCARMDISKVEESKQLVLCGSFVER